MLVQGNDQCKVPGTKDSHNTELCFLYQQLHIHGKIKTEAN